MERIYIEKGVIAKEEILSDYDEYQSSLHFSNVLKIEADDNDEIIGHLQNNDGANLGDLVVVNNDEYTQRRTSKIFINIYHSTKYCIHFSNISFSTFIATSKKRATKFICDICHKGFIHEYRFMKHRETHHHVRYECTKCLEQFSERFNFIQHQKETGHTGEGIVESLEVCLKFMISITFMISKTYISSLAKCASFKK